MFRARRIRSGALGTIGALLLILATMAASASASQAPPPSEPARAAARAPTCDPLTTFQPGNFHTPTRIDNTFLPLVPGTQLTLQGVANVGGGLLDHVVVFTVTDLTKVINGVRTVVVWDVDRSQGVLVESELAFFAQDDAGNVWNLGEYPEEFESGVFIGAPSTWIHGLDGAQGGIHMTQSPTLSTSFHLQGSAPSIDFLDCARVTKTGQTACVPFTAPACYEGVVETEETSPLDPQGGSQIKSYAPGVGVVHVGAVNDPEGETLTLVDLVQLNQQALEAVRQEALRLDAHAYEVSVVYRETPPVEAPAPPPPPPQQPASAQLSVSVAANPPARLSARTARAAVRRILRTRLRGWIITRVSCRLRPDGRAACSFTAKRRGARLRGGGIVRLRASDGALRYRLAIRITKTNCRPATSSRCTRRTTWSAPAVARK